MLRENRVLAGSVFVALVGLFLISSLDFLPFLSDDALISFRYAERFAAGEGLSWTDGAPVEGYSNLLWILLLAGLDLANVELVRAARALGLGFSCLTLALLLIYALRWKNLRECGWSLAIAAVCLASAAPFGVWAIGGLEQPLFTASLALLVASTLALLRSPHDGRADWFCRVAGAALVLTRPDGILLVGCVALALASLGRGSIPLTRQIRLWLPAFVAVVAQEAFRLSYYGDWLPNSARIKLPASAAYLARGWDYLRWGLRALMPLPLLAVGGLILLWRDRAHRAAVAVLALPMLAWSAYVVAIGGDIFPAWRHILPLLVLFVFALVEAQLREVRVPLVGRSRRVALLVGLFTVGGFSFIQQADRENQRAHAERWEWHGKEIGAALREAFAESQPLVAVSAAGCIPYWSKLPALDMLGLSDAHIARQAPALAGSGFLGHEFGDGAYVLGREPDVICFGVGAAEPGFRSGLELWESERFHLEYQPIRLRFTRPEPFTATLFLRKSSEKVGVIFDQDTVRLPAYLFAAAAGAMAHVAEDGSWELELDAGVSVDLQMGLADSENWQPQSGVGWTLAPVGVEQPRVLRLRNHGLAPLRLREFRLARAELRG